MSTPMSAAAAAIVAAAMIAARRHGRTSTEGATASAAAVSQNPTSAFDEALPPAAERVARKRATTPATETIAGQSVRMPTRLIAIPIATRARTIQLQPSAALVTVLMVPSAAVYV